MISPKPSRTDFFGMFLWLKIQVWCRRNLANTPHTLPADILANPSRVLRDTPYSADTLRYTHSLAVYHDTVKTIRVNARAISRKIEKLTHSVTPPTRLKRRVDKN